MRQLSNEEILNKGCYVEFAGSEYYCYNETSLLHFVKLGAKGQHLSYKNKANLLNVSRTQVLSFIRLNSAKILIGNRT